MKITRAPAFVWHFSRRPSGYGGQVGGQATPPQQRAHTMNKDIIKLVTLALLPTAILTFTACSTPMEGVE
jgi:hypothetical protein